SSPSPPTAAPSSRQVPPAWVSQGRPLSWQAAPGTPCPAAEAAPPPSTNRAVQPSRSNSARRSKASTTPRTTSAPSIASSSRSVHAISAVGGLPDAIMSGMVLCTPSQVAIYGEMGMFVPVDELIDRLAPHIREMFEQFPEMRSLFTAPDGRMYAVPSMNDCYHCKTGEVRTWINSDHVSADEHPQTLAEFESLMSEIKEHP